MRVRGIVICSHLAQRRLLARRRRVERRPAVVTVDLPEGPRHDRLVLVLDAGSHAVSQATSQRIRSSMSPTTACAGSAEQKLTTSLPAICVGPQKVHDAECAKRTYRCGARHT